MKKTRSLVGQIPEPDELYGREKFLARLASPTMRQAWLHAARRLLGAQPPEIRQALGFLEPVCKVLEGGEKRLLDPLPPEQRECVASAIVCDGVSAAAVVFAPEYGNEDDHQI